MATKAPHKFVGHALFDALRDVGLLPESERFLDTVILNAEVSKPCKLTFRYRHTPERGAPLFSDETVLVQWPRLFDALKTAGLFPVEDHLCRRLTVRAPVDGVCTVTYECFADSRLLDLINDGAIETGDNVVPVGR